MDQTDRKKLTKFCWLPKFTGILGGKGLSSIHSGKDLAAKQQKDSQDEADLTHYMAQKFFKYFWHWLVYSSLVVWNAWLLWNVPFSMLQNDNQLDQCGDGYPHTQV